DVRSIPAVQVRAYISEYCSFRHTIRGRSDRGFYVANEADRVTVRNDSTSDMVWPYWTHDDLINAFVSKLWRVIVVKGVRRMGKVKYDTAHVYREPQSRQFIGAIVSGIVAIDFDVRTLNGRGLRNHGTKFRIAYGGLRHLCHYSKRLS
ncbi:MAG: MvaI/BcnI family restriction endonuclease, partial [Thaumarchaeota archaeon]|nr:MvaI/BcnI family restriction endonuclease [Nitrososphaerota archaeon]